MQKLASGFFPFQQVGDFAIIQPKAVLFTSVYDDAAALAKIYPTHKLPANRAFDISYFLVCLEAVFIDVFDKFSVDIENFCNWTGK